MQLIGKLSYIVKAIFLHLILTISIVLMLVTVLDYTAFEDDVRFLLQKKDYLNNKLWKFAFYTHTFSAFFTLFAGFTQFSKLLLNNYNLMHKFIGKIYVVLIVFINFPTALIMAIYANGGLLAKLGFLTLDIFWLLFTLKAFLYAKRKNFLKHAKFMIRSFALTFSAITFRLWKPVLINLFMVENDKAYVIQSWLGFLPNLLIAEFLIIKFYLVNLTPNKSRIQNEIKENKKSVAE
jgi:hypothetical protein